MFFAEMAEACLFPQFI